MPAFSACISSMMCVLKMINPGIIILCLRQLCKYLVTIWHNNYVKIARDFGAYSRGARDSKNGKSGWKVAEF